MDGSRCLTELLGCRLGRWLPLEHSASDHGPAFDQCARSAGSTCAKPYQRATGHSYWLMHATPARRVCVRDWARLARFTRRLHATSGHRREGVRATCNGWALRAPATATLPAKNARCQAGAFMLWTARVQRKQRSTAISEHTFGHCSGTDISAL
jgi:hypothetical protein